MPKIVSKTANNTRVPGWIFFWSHLFWGKSEPGMHECSALEPRLFFAIVRLWGGGHGLPIKKIGTRFESFDPIWDQKKTFFQ
jgi:hypothetical protein